MDDFSGEVDEEVVAEALAVDRVESLDEELVREPKRMLVERKRIVHDLSDLRREVVAIISRVREEGLRLIRQHDPIQIARAAILKQFVKRVSETSFVKRVGRRASDLA